MPGSKDRSLEIPLGFIANHNPEELRSNSMGCNV